ncbi:PAS domain S-box protein [Leptolyngbya sp. FACHB-541]|uniref:PAS domain S-box protein n=1 Tax=Leptolyngbya sp. FACHB-541 TaxID=2692810 RepID=UPI001685A009|nr:PAS domain S-box protein [Leptolyngbya sp. FACHB-541]MBD2000794.1 PAS domain S-box protein [Leptolyngbya sp. FACHB-541]
MPIVSLRASSQSWQSKLRHYQVPLQLVLVAPFVLGIMTATGTIYFLSWSSNQQIDLFTALLLGLITLVGAIALSLVFACLVVKPIVQLSKASKAIADGEDQQIPTRLQIRELETMAQAFNQMAQRLQNSFEEVKAALQESETKFTKVFQYSPDPMTITTLAEGRIVEVNDSFLDFYGFSHEETVGRTTTELNFWQSPEERSLFKEQLERAGTVDNLEFSIKTASGETKTILLSAEVMDLDGQACVLAIRRNISDRKLVERLLQERFALQQQYLTELTEWRTRYEAAGQASEQILYEWDINAERITWGPNTKEILGYTIAEMPQTLDGWMELLDPEHPEILRSEIENAIAQDDSYLAEYRIRRQDGTYIWIEDKSRFFTDSSGELVRVIGFIADVSDRKLAETKLRQSETALLAAQRVVHVGSWEVDIENFSGSWSEELFRIFGLDPNQPRPTRAEMLQQFIHPDDLEKVQQADNRTLAEGAPYQIDHRIIRPDGSIRHVEARGEVTLNDRGNVVKLFGTVLDITDRKQTEAIIRENEIRFRAIFEQAAVGIGEISLTGRYLNANPRYCEILGYSKAELLERTFHEITYPDDLDKTLEHFQQLLTGQVSIASIEKRYVCKDKHTCWANVSVSLVHDEAGIPLYAICVIEDITERKQLELALQASEAKLDSILNSAIASILSFRLFPDRTWQYDYFSAGCETIFGYTPAELMADHTLWISRVPIEDQQTVIIPAFDALFTKQIAHKEYRFQHKDGSLRWICSTAIARHEADYWRVTAVDTDITERKQLELALQASETNVNNILKCAIASIMQFRIFADRTWQCDYISPSCEAVYGYTQQEIMANPDLFYSEVVPEDWETVLAPLFEDIFAERSSQAEYRFRDKAGNLRWIAVSFTSQRDETTDSWIVTSIEIDITNRKQLELALQATQTKLSDLINSAIASITSFRVFPDKTWKYDYISLGCEAIFGYSNQELMANPDLWAANVDPEDQENILVPLFEEITAERVATAEYRFLHPDGRLRWISSNLSSRWDEATNSWVVTTVATDITKRKQLDLALQESEKQFREITENIHDVFFVETADATQTLYTSSAFEEIYGSSRERLYDESQGWINLVHPNDRELVLATLSEQQLGQRTSKEYRIVKPDGSVHWIFARTFPIFDQQGQLLRHVGISEDVTEQKAIEETLLKQQEMLRTIFDNVPVMLTFFSAEGQLIWANHEFETVLGWSVEELRERHNPMAEFYPDPEYRQQVMDSIQLADRSWRDFRIRTRSGRVIETTWANVKLSDGSNIGIGQDISDRKQIILALEEANRELHHLANLDGLTQIANRRGFDEHLQREWNRLTREEASLSLLLCDIDYFKLYNDTYGHIAGDQCLRQIAQAIAEILKRPGDLVSRYGGEEFAVILPNTTAEGAIQVAEFIQSRVQQLQLEHRRSPVFPYLTVSIGIATTVPVQQVLPDALVAVSDGALYQAKAQGRNTFCLCAL